MFWVFGCELGFYEIEISSVLVITIVDPEAEKAGQVKDEKKRQVGEDTAFGGIEMNECIFYEIE